MRRRLDQELVRRGLAGTLGEARAAIVDGRVTLAGAPAAKPGTLVAAEEPLAVAGPARPYASRGGEKLAAGLEGFEMEVLGALCLDAGASTGGFTDVLLARGAAHVAAVDVGYGQLDWRLRTDERVTVMERTNVRDLRAEHLPFRPDVLVADLSFISLRSAVPALAALSADRARFVLLVKPQFEARHERVPRGGVVSEPGAWRSAVEGVAEACERAGLGPLAVMASPLRGPAGNVEFLLYAREGEPGRDLDIGRVLEEVPA